MTWASYLLHFLFVLLPFIGSQLWFVGGAYNKVFRRVVWPGIVGVTLMLVGVPVVPSLLVSVLLGAVHTLPYGEGLETRFGRVVAWVIRTAVAASYGLAFYPITHNFLAAIVTVLAFIPTYAVSRNNNNYSWPSVEAGVGAAEGAILLHYVMIRAILVLFGLA